MNSRLNKIGDILVYEDLVIDKWKLFIVLEMKYGCVVHDLDMRYGGSIRVKTDSWEEFYLVKNFLVLFNKEEVYVDYVDNKTIKLINKKYRAKKREYTYDLGMLENLWEENNFYGIKKVINLSKYAERI